MPDEQWPFDQPRSCAVITLRSIVLEGRPILHVSHDADDHGWQFLDGGKVDEADAMVVALEEMVEIDPSVLEVAELPPGWYAERASPSDRWKRRPRSRR